MHVLTLYVSNECFIAVKEREKAAKQQAHAQQAQNKKGAASAPKKGPSTAPARQMDQNELDIAGLNLADDAPLEVIPEEPPKTPAAIEKLIEEAKAALTAQEKGERRSLSMVVVGASSGTA